MPRVLRKKFGTSITYLLKYIRYLLTYLDILGIYLSFNVKTEYHTYILVGRTLGIPYLIIGCTP